MFLGLYSKNSPGIFGAIFFDLEGLTAPERVSTLSLNGVIFFII